MALVCFSWKLLSCKVMSLTSASPWGPSLTTEDTSEKHLLIPWRRLPHTLRKATVTCLLPHALARLNSQTGGDTWFSSLESKFIHASIFSWFVRISRVSWTLFCWHRFGSRAQLSVAISQRVHVTGNNPTSAVWHAFLYCALSPSCFWHKPFYGKWVSQGPEMDIKSTMYSHFIISTFDLPKDGIVNMY